MSVETAKKAAAAALAETRKNNWLMAVAVVDPSGDLVYYENSGMPVGGGCRTNFA